MAFGKFLGGSDNLEESTPIAKIEPVLKPTTGKMASSSTAYIGSSASIVGSLKFDCPAEIGAFVEGEIESTSRLTILDSGVIKGSIKAKELIIKGKIQGNIFAEETLALCAPACIQGDINTPRLSVEAGVIFEGKCIMPEKSKVEVSTVTEGANIASAN